MRLLLEGTIQFLPPTCPAHGATDAQYVYDLHPAICQMVVIACKPVTLASFSGLSSLRRVGVPESQLGKRPATMGCEYGQRALSQYIPAAARVGPLSARRSASSYHAPGVSGHFAARHTRLWILICRALGGARAPGRRGCRYVEMADATHVGGIFFHQWGHLAPGPSELR